MNNCTNENNEIIYKFLDCSDKYKLVCISSDIYILEYKKDLCEDENRSPIEFRKLGKQNSVVVNFDNPFTEREEENPNKFLMVYLLSKICKKDIEISITYFNNNDVLLWKCFCEFLRFIGLANHDELKIEMEEKMLIKYKNVVLYERDNVLN